MEGLHTLLFLCRFNIEEISARGPYHVVRVSRLDMTKIGKVLNKRNLFCSVCLPVHCSLKFLAFIA